MHATEELARLELEEPEGAFRALERWLVARGFFTPAADGLVADLYLGYGLSQAIRRRSTPPPPEPCRLPLLSCVVRSRGCAVDDVDNEPAENPAAIGPWKGTWTGSEYEAAVERVREAIARGDVYQVNLVQHLVAPVDGNPSALVTALASVLTRFDPLIREPLSGDGWTIASASPELFLARRGRRVWTMRRRTQRST
jgi:para-aminobenzoate synthetase component I